MGIKARLEDYKAEIGLKAHLEDYKREVIVTIFLASIVIILMIVIVSNEFFVLTRTEEFLLNLFISFVALIISVVLFLNKSVRLSSKSIEKILTATNEIKDTLTDTLPQALPQAIPQNLFPPLKRLLKNEKEKYTETYDIITKGEQYTVQKEEMYQKLTDFAAVMEEEDSNEILAVSSVDIYDFQTNPHAKIYLDKNEECVRRSVPVKRIFLLSNADLKNKGAVKIVRTHGEKLSEVKWVDKKFLNSEEREQDFAIFNDCILVDQRIVPAYIISDPRQINRFKRIFSKIWDNPNCISWEELRWGKE